MPTGSASAAVQSEPRLRAFVLRILSLLVLLTLATTLGYLIGRPPGAAEVIVPANARLSGTNSVEINAGDDISGRVLRGGPGEEPVLRSDAEIAAAAAAQALPGAARRTGPLPPRPREWQPGRASVIGDSGISISVRRSDDAVSMAEVERLNWRGDWLNRELGRMQAEVNELKLLFARLADVAEIDDGEFEVPSQAALVRELLEEQEKQHQLAVAAPLRRDPVEAPHDELTLAAKASVPSTPLAKELLAPASEMQVPFSAASALLPWWRLETRLLLGLEPRTAPVQEPVLAASKPEAPVRVTTTSRSSVSQVPRSSLLEERALRRAVPSVDNSAAVPESQNGALDDDEQARRQIEEIQELMAAMDDQQSLLTRDLDLIFQESQRLERLFDGRRVDWELGLVGLPLLEGTVSSSFGPRHDPFSGKMRLHQGLDFLAPVGTPILALGDGVVTYAGHSKTYGYLVELEHGGGYRTRYAHNKRNLVRRGQRVEKGERIALLGNTGRSTGPHLHLEVRHRGTALDPASFVR